MKFELDKTNFQYNIQYTYSTETNCAEEGCDSICRCATIEGFKILSIDVSEIAKNIEQKLEARHRTGINLYCIDRILHTFKIYEEENWKENIINSYYGEEVESIKLDYKISKEIQAEINKITALKTIKEKLFHVLTLEYGSVLDILKDKDFTIQTIETSKVFFGHKEHYKKLDRKIVSKYTNYKFPRGIVVVDEDRYRVIDGYHRICANKKETVEVFVGR